MPVVQVYAFTSSPLHIAILRLFVRCACNIGTTHVVLLTWQSFKNAAYRCR